MKYRYYAQHMHMHSCYQPGASMEGHMYHARNLDMKYIWITDHDNRMGRKKYEIDGFTFEAKKMFAAGPTGLKSGFLPLQENQTGCVELTKEDAYTGKKCMRLWTGNETDSWMGTGVYFHSDGKRHCASLLAGIRLQLAYKVKCGNLENARLIFDVRLSERPPEHTRAHILYVVGNADGLDKEPHTLVIPLDGKAQWQETVFELSADVLSEAARKNDLGGLDNAFDTLTIRVESRCGEEITVWIDDFTKHVQRSAQETIEMQKAVAAEIGKQYGVVPFVAKEISAAGPHKNCFGTSVPVIPYEAMGYEVSHEQACEWVKRHGGIFALNHPFEKYKRMNLTNIDYNTETEQLAKEYIDNNCWGATLIEVGFPQGRCFPLDCYLRLWDLLSLHGMFLTGYGSSDNHSNQPEKWYQGNNFATWLGVEIRDDEQKEEDFLLAMKSGRAYMGDPVRIKGEIILESCEGAPMGSVVEVNAPDKKQVSFAADCLEAGWCLKWIVNGEVQKESVIGAKSWEESCFVETTLPVNLVRVELYDEEHRCILLTNPVYFYRKDLGVPDIPEERRI